MINITIMQTIKNGGNSLMLITIIFIPHLLSNQITDCSSSFLKIAGLGFYNCNNGTFK